MENRQMVLDNTKTKKFVEAFIVLDEANNFVVLGEAKAFNKVVSRLESSIKTSLTDFEIASIKHLDFNASFSSDLYISNDKIVKGKVETTGFDIYFTVSKTTTAFEVEVKIETLKLETKEQAEERIEREVKELVEEESTRFEEAVEENEIEVKRTSKAEALKMLEDPEFAASLLVNN